VAEREPRGEMVIVLAGAPEPGAATPAQVDDALRAELDRGASARDAAASVAAALGVPKRTAYDAAVRLRAP
jgi:16S rRNA (cytidine1402-2'-O)-methyltransferase